MKLRNRILGLALVVIVVLVVAYFGVGLLVATRLTAPANEPMEATPTSVGLDFRRVEVKSTDGIRLSGWWVPKAESNRAVLLVHGWGGNKSNEQVLATAPIYARAGYNVLMLDLRAETSPTTLQRIGGATLGRTRLQAEKREKHEILELAANRNSWHYSLPM